jgi:glucosamine kinase
MIFVGIDAGGTNIRAKAVDDDDVTLFEGTAGPANLTTTSEEEVGSNVLSALDGCPEPNAVAGCFAGIGSPSGAAFARRLLEERFPGAKLGLFPDCAAAIWASSADTTVVVIAGTGSVVCSKSQTGSIYCSGGTGLLLGDHGSAARFGAALLTRFLDDPNSMSVEVGAAIKSEFGAIDRPTLIRATHQSPLPVPSLGRLAPYLTEAAEDGQSWALESVRVEEIRLAGLTRRHLERHHFGVLEPVVALAGSVWLSTLVRKEFESALEIPTKNIERSSVDGAVRAARGLIEDGLV